MKDNVELLKKLRGTSGRILTLGFDAPGLPPIGRVYHTVKDGQGVFIIDARVGQVVTDDGITAPSNTTQVQIDARQKLLDTAFPDGDAECHILAGLMNHLKARFLRTKDQLSEFFTPEELDKFDIAVQWRLKELH
jgi:hypothetical protein